MFNKKFSGIFVVIIALLMIPLLYSCNKKNKAVVAEIGDEKIYLYEFENAFAKNSQYPDSLKYKTLEQKKDFLNVLIAFRLKAKDARERGMLDLPDIQQDIKDFQKNIHIFLTDKKVVLPAIEKLYERKKSEVRASHILITLPVGATEADSIKAYQKAEQIMKRLEAGEDFAVVAKETSDDGSVVKNNGDLYYFTGGNTVPEFEDAVYDLGVGQISKKPVRTMFGLHIIKLTDKRKRLDAIRASHILIQDARDSAGAIVDSMATLKKAQDILNQLKNNGDFNKLAIENSQDPGSAQKGGDLGFFQRRRMEQTFDSVAFSLSPGETSGLVRTPFGWHIIKVTEVRELPTYEKMYEVLKAEFKRSEAFKKDYAKYLAEVKKEYKFELNSAGMKLLTSKLDSTQTFGVINFDTLFTSQDKENIIASFEGGSIKVGDVILFLKSNPMFSGSVALYKTILNIIDESANPVLLNYVAFKEKIDKSDEYVEQLTEYENGLLKFKVEQEEIQSKIKITQEDMQKYYEENKTKFSYTDPNTNEQRVKNFDEVKGEISNELQQKKFAELDKIYIENLKQKFQIKIYDSVLDKAFKE
jgi:peptidyl-prolyl cis-trans isomerase SurA